MPTMSDASASIEIAASVSEVWPFLAEFRHWPEWGPSVRAVEAGRKAVAPGLRGRVQTSIGLWLPFEIGRCEPERFWDWKVAGVRATGHRLVAIDSARTRVDFTVPRAFFPYIWVLDRGLRRLASLAESSRA
ncbi:MAG: SRPBCC family protein [Myxococcota bacterium]